MLLSPYRHSKSSSFLGGVGGFLNKTDGREFYIHSNCCRRCYNVKTINMLNLFLDPFPDKGYALKISPQIFFPWPVQTQLHVLFIKLYQRRIF